MLCVYNKFVANEEWYQINQRKQLMNGVFTGFKFVILILKFFEPKLWIFSKWSDYHHPRIRWKFVHDTIFHKVKSNYHYHIPHTFIQEPSLSPSVDPSQSPTSDPSATPSEVCDQFLSPSISIKPKSIHYHSYYIISILINHDWFSFRRSWWK